MWHAPCFDDQGHILQLAAAGGPGAGRREDLFINLEAAVHLGDFDSGDGVLNGDEFHDIQVLWRGLQIGQYTTNYCCMENVVFAL